MVCFQLEEESGAQRTQRVRPSGAVPRNFIRYIQMLPLINLLLHLGARSKHRTS